MIKILIFSVTALIASFIAGFIFGKRKGKPKKQVQKEDVYNIVNGINQKENLAILYKSLLIKVHPDKNPGNIMLAEKYTTLINKHRRDFDKLNHLQKEIEDSFKQ